MGNLGSISTHTETQRHAYKLHQLPSSRQPKANQIRLPCSRLLLPLPLPCPEEGEDQVRQRGMGRDGDRGGGGRGDERRGEGTDGGRRENRRREKGGIRKSRERYHTHFLDLLLCYLDFPFHLLLPLQFPPSLTSFFLGGFTFTCCQSDAVMVSMMLLLVLY